MNYAIIINTTYKRENLKGIYRHNERKNKNYSNKNIDATKSYLNYSLKDCKYTYEKEFERSRKEYNLKGQVNEIDNINITIDDIKKAIYFIESCKESANLENNQCFIFENRELEDEILNVVKFSFELNKMSKQ